jgi:hypothetical protein
MKQIPLTQDKIALVDDEDFEYLNQWKWYADKRRYSWYAQRHKPHSEGGGTILMHVVIMKPGPKIEIDHKDGNGLNNQKSNLRPSTRAQNARNRVHLRASKISRYRGVTLEKRSKARPWIAIICAGPPDHKGFARHIRLGHFVTEEEAALAWDAAARKHFGEFVTLNFPERQPQ